MAIIDSVIPTAATASGPNFETKKTSTTAKSDSIAISMTIGTASRTMARGIEPSVKSWRDPRMASRTIAQTRVARLASGVVRASQGESSIDNPFTAETQSSHEAATEVLLVFLRVFVSSWLELSKQIPLRLKDTKKHQESCQKPKKLRSTNTKTRRRRIRKGSTAGDRQAAIHHNLGARYVRRFVRGKKQSTVGNVFRLG